MTCKEYGLRREGSPLSDVLTGVVPGNSHNGRTSLIFLRHPLRGALLRIACTTLTDGTWVGRPKRVKQSDGGWKGS